MASPLDVPFTAVPSRHPDVRFSVRNLLGGLASALSSEEADLPVRGKARELSISASQHWCSFTH